MVTPKYISNLPLFTSMLEFCGNDDPVIELPEVRELKKSVLIHLILFQLYPDEYQISPTHLET